MFLWLISCVIRNIIFDWSGTLVDDLPAVWKATNFVLAKAERPEMSLEEFRAEFSLPFVDFYDRHTPDVPLPQLELVSRPLPRDPGFGLRTAACARLSRILPRKETSYVRVKHHSKRTFFDSEP